MVRFLGFLCRPLVDFSSIAQLHMVFNYYSFTIRRCLQTNPPPPCSWEYSGIFPVFWFFPTHVRIQASISWKSCCNSDGSCIKSRGLFGEDLYFYAIKFPYSYSEAIHPCIWSFFNIFVCTGFLCMCFTNDFLDLFQSNWQIFVHYTFLDIDFCISLLYPATLLSTCFSTNL